MRSMTAQEAREYCGQMGDSLQIAEDGSLSFDDEKSFSVQSPRDYRQLAFLSHSIAECAPQGGLLWLHFFHGAENAIEVGWKIIEDMRKAVGDSSPLQVAPAQLFAESDATELQVVLMQVLGNGWGGYFVPSTAPFAIGFRTSHQLFCYSDCEAEIEHMRSKFEAWTPKEVEI